MTLTEFWNNNNGNVEVWFKSVGIPTGVTVTFMDEDEETGELYPVEDVDERLPFSFDLEGTLCSQGDWQWEGRGHPVDWNFNQVLAITAYGVTRSNS